MSARTLETPNLDAAIAAVEKALEARQRFAVETQRLEASGMSRRDAWRAAEVIVYGNNSAPAWPGK